MSRKILWTSLAIEDLAAIIAYIARDKPMAARREAKRLRKGATRLARFPHSGRMLKTIPSVFEMVISNYHLFYRLREKRVEILRLYHARQQLPYIA